MDGGVRPEGHRGAGVDPSAATPPLARGLDKPVLHPAHVRFGSFLN